MATHRTTRGAILLESILALTLFLLAAVMVGGAVQGSMRSSQRITERGRAMQLCQSILDQVRAQYLVAHDGTEGTFAPQFPGYVYRIHVDEAVDIPDLRYVTVTVGWASDVVRRPPDADLSALSPPESIDAVPVADTVTLTTWLYGAPPPPAEEEPAEEGEEAPADGAEEGP